MVCGPPDGTCGQDRRTPPLRIIDRTGHTQAMSLDADLGIAVRWHAEGKQVAAATVVDVRGTAPRPPGARMLVSSVGDVAGSGSGGCVGDEIISGGAQA